MAFPTNIADFGPRKDARNKSAHSWGRHQSRQDKLYEKSWGASVPAMEAPPGLAPSTAVMRQISEVYPTVSVLRDGRPERRCFVLWENTRKGPLVIQDVPRGHPIDRRILDHLFLCDMSKKPGMQSVIDACDSAAEGWKQDKIRKESKETDWDRVMWAGRRDARDVHSTPFGVFSQVPRSYDGKS